MFIMNNSETYLQITDIAQGRYFSSTLADLFLSYYECCNINNSLHSCRHIDIIFISTDNITFSVLVALPSYLKITKNTPQNDIINILDLKLIFKNYKIYNYLLKT